MTITLAHIWRHPIKGVGAEALEQADLTIGRPVPLDRAFAILEDGGEAGSGWRSCRNFLRGAKGPSLMAITARTKGDVIHLSHPDRPDIAINPKSDAQALFDWLHPIYPEDRKPPVDLVASPPEGMSDAPFASISILNLKSLAALSSLAGADLDMRRFRGNLWMAGAAPWEEFDLIGKTIKLGGATLEVVEPIGRCRATEANPATGKRDVNTLALLERGWGHMNFGVYAQVKTSGSIALGDSIEVIS